MCRELEYELGPDAEPALRAYMAKRMEMPFFANARTVRRARCPGAARPLRPRHGAGPQPRSAGRVYMHGAGGAAWRRGWPRRGTRGTASAAAAMTLPRPALWETLARTLARTPTHGRSVTPSTWGGCARRSASSTRRRRPAPTAWSSPGSCRPCRGATSPPSRSSMPRWRRRALHSRRAAPRTHAARGRPVLAMFAWGFSRVSWFPRYS